MHVITRVIRKAMKNERARIIDLAEWAGLNARNISRWNYGAEPTLDSALRCLAELGVWIEFRDSNGRVLEVLEPGSYNPANQRADRPIQ
jgi:hypothetical protein